MVLLTNESIVRSYELLSSSNEDIEAEKQFAIDLKNKLESFRESLTKTTMKKLESLYLNLKQCCFLNNIVDKLYTMWYDVSINKTIVR